VIVAGAALLVAAGIGAVILLGDDGETTEPFGSQPSKADQAQERADRTLTEAVVKRPAGLSVRYPEGWKRSELEGAIRLESPDRCALISFSAPDKAAGAARVRRESISVIRGLFVKSQVHPQPPAELGGAPTTSAVVAGRRRKGPTIAVQASVSKGSGLAHLTEVLLRRPPCAGVAPQIRLILGSIEFSR
jgi:hypothetical protein